MKKLHPTAAALSVGLLWGVVLFIWTLVAVNNGYGMSFLDLIAEVYPAYEVSGQGAFLGLIWGFLDGFIGVYILVWLYNYFLGKLGK